MMHKFMSTHHVTWDVGILSGQIVIEAKENGTIVSDMRMDKTAAILLAERLLHFANMLPEESNEPA
jgi:hypothetical protein